MLDTLGPPSTLQLSNFVTVQFRKLTKIEKISRLVFFVNILEGRCMGSRMGSGQEIVGGSTFGAFGRGAGDTDSFPVLQCPTSFSSSLSTSSLSSYLSSSSSSSSSLPAAVQPWPPAHWVEAAQATKAPSTLHLAGNMFWPSTPQLGPSAGHASKCRDQPETLADQPG